MKHKFFYITLITLVSLTVFIFFYFSKYDIANERQAIEIELNEWENRGVKNESKYKILEIEQIDKTNSYIILFQNSEENIGYAQLIKGLNGKFRIEKSGSGISIYSYSYFKTNQGLYGILIGNNMDLKIHFTKVKYEDKEFVFESNVSDEKVFAEYQELPNSFGEAFPTEIILYDANHENLYPLRIEP